MVYNYMELLVEQYLQEILDTEMRYHDVCKCEKCMDDMKAYALNHIAPFYVTGLKGEVFGQYHTKVQQVKMDVTKEVVNAINIVSQNKHV